MTRKEFIKRMDEIFCYMSSKNYHSYSCAVIWEYVSVEARDSYNKYIRIFTIFGLLSYAGCGYEDRAPLRMLLLQSFKEEVLSTKKYLEF